MDILRYLSDMPKKAAAEGALFVRLPATAVGKLDRAAEALGMRKKDLVAGLVSKYVDPDSRRGLSVLGSLATHKVTVELGQKDPTVGAFSFQPYDSPEPSADGPPEVLSAEQAGQLLQIGEAVVREMAEAGKLPGRKLGFGPGAVWRFSRAALVAWLSAPEKTEKP
jgi:excisionase family DNA binding protein